MLKRSERSIALLLLAAVMLASCSEKNEANTSSYVRSSDISSVASTDTNCSLAENASTGVNETVDSTESTSISLVRTGDNTLKSADDRLEAGYDVYVSENLIRITVSYMNIGEYEMSCNTAPKVYADGSELEETFYGSELDSIYHVIGIGETYEDVFEYDHPDSDEVSIIFNVDCECMYELDSKNPDDDNKKTWLAGAFYTSDCEENGEDDFVISLE